MFLLRTALALLCGLWPVESASVTFNPRDCAEVQQQGLNRSGIYRVQAPWGPRQVLCDLETGAGGWTVVQQRWDGAEPFWNRTWAEYKQGFGQVSQTTDFYAGNDLIYHLTNQCRPPSALLRVELRGDRNPDSPTPDGFWFSEYKFHIDSEAQAYTAHVSVNRSHLVGNASTGWYDLTYADLNPFSTVDSIHDPNHDCQLKFRMGGWWTKNCGLASLNGEYEPREWADGYGLFFVVAGRQVVNPHSTRMLVRSTCS